MENSSDIGNSRGLRGRAAEEGEKSRDGLLFVQKEIFRNLNAPCAHTIATPIINAETSTAPTLVIKSTTIVGTVRIPSTYRSL
jgi:hypothetical protein